LNFAESKFKHFIITNINDRKVTKAICSSTDFWPLRNINKSLYKWLIHFQWISNQSSRSTNFVILLFYSFSVKRWKIRFLLFFLPITFQIDEIFRNKSQSISRAIKFVAKEFFSQEEFEFVFFIYQRRQLNFSTSELLLFHVWIYPNLHITLLIVIHLVLFVNEENFTLSRSSFEFSENSLMNSSSNSSSNSSLLHALKVPTHSFNLTISPLMKQGSYFVGKHIFL
jgi:hypothetical protein